MTDRRRGYVRDDARERTLICIVVMVMVRVRVRVMVRVRVRVRVMVRVRARVILHRGGVMLFVMHKMFIQ